VNPYLRLLYDALYDMLDVERVARYLERGTIEIAPIAFMRGRTLNDSFVILDEAQNTTSEQMKMFLTRLGFGAKAVITNTPIHLPAGKMSVTATAEFDHSTADSFTRGANPFELHLGRARVEGAISIDIPITSRREPAVANRRPLISSGVHCRINSGRLPKLSVLNCQATSSLLKFSPLI